MEVSTRASVQGARSRPISLARMTLRSPSPSNETERLLRRVDISKSARTQLAQDTTSRLRATTVMAVLTQALAPEARSPLTFLVAALLTREPTCVRSPSNQMARL